jgi:hypothetical protein
MGQPYGRGGDAQFNQTATAGTRIQVCCGGVQGWVTQLSQFNYTPGATAHTLTMMRSQTATTTTQAVAAGGTTVPCASLLTTHAGGAANSAGLVGIQLDDGTWLLSTLNGVPNTTTFSLTLTTAVPTGRSIPIKSTVCYFGLASDAYHAAYQIPSSVAGSGSLFTLPIINADVSLCKASLPGQPIVFDSNNATNAGTLTSIYFGYLDQYVVG